MKESPTRSPAQSAIAAQASSGPLSQRSTGRVAAQLREAVEFVDEVLAGDGAVDEAA